MDFDRLQARVDRLERRQSVVLRGAGTLFLIAAAATLMAQTPPAPLQPEPDMRSLPLKASQIELVDSRGRTRAVLRMDNGSPQLEFHDAYGRPALELAVRGNDGVIEYAERGERLNLMKPAPRVNPLTVR